MDQAALQVEAQGGTIGHRYDTCLLGFSATLSESLIYTLEAHPDVMAIEGDGHMYAFKK